MTTVRLRILAGALFAVAATLVALLMVWNGSEREASADTPHPGLDFYIAVDVNGDTTDDCDTDGGSGASATCNFAAPGGSFKVKFYVLDNGGLTYMGYDAILNYDGVTAPGTWDSTMPDPGTFPECTFAAANFSTPGVAAIGCASADPPLGPGPSTYTGSMARVNFVCATTGSVRLQHGVGATDLVDTGGNAHSEASSGEENLQINCGGGVTNTPTVTRTPTPTVLTNTPTVTRTRTPTRTATQTPAYENGDVNGSHSLNSLDSLLILQFTAGFLTMDQIDNFGDPDCNKNTDVDSVDALLILQVDAGFIGNCPG